MKDQSIDREEARARRLALVHEFSVDKLRDLYEAGKATGVDDPVACVFQVTAGGGYNALKALGIEKDQEAVLLPLSDVMEVATKCRMHDLADVLTTRFMRSEFAVLCVAWDGWTLFYPDQPGGMEPQRYERASDAGPTEPTPKPN